MANKYTLMHTLRSIFGYQDFKNQVQREAIVKICEGAANMCISMPPGFGRSLCFQLPLLFYTGKVAIIISPKLSFILKQVDFLRSKQINVGFLYKNMNKTERDYVISDLTSNSPTIVLLYVTPEMHKLMYFMKLLGLLKNRKLLSYVVFNEAHTLSTWGYEYTSYYRQIVCSQMYESLPRIALTTSVTDKVIEDICKLLALKNPKIFKIPMQQINIYYDVWFLDIIPNPFDHLKNFIIEVLGILDLPTDEVYRNFAIIYCTDEGIVKLLKDKLNARGIKTLDYHYNLKVDDKRNTEENWISRKSNVIITTYDYGFIHKNSIRCIVYWKVPNNIAKFYKECAQICLKNKAFCRIYFSTDEYVFRKSFIKNCKKIIDAEHTKNQLDEYNKIVSYCLSVNCRHKIISKYFGNVISSCKMNCDVCMDEETVRVRTLKFMKYSEKVKGIKYDICDVNEDLKENHMVPSIITQQLLTKPNVTEQHKDTLERECQKLVALSNRTTLDAVSSIVYFEKSDDEFEQMLTKLTINEQFKDTIEDKQCQIILDTVSNIDTVEQCSDKFEQQVLTKPNIIEQSKDTLKKEDQKSNTLNNGTTTDTNNDIQRIEQSNDEFDQILMEFTIDEKFEDIPEDEECQIVFDKNNSIGCFKQPNDKFEQQILMKSNINKKPENVREKECETLKSCSEEITIIEDSNMQSIEQLDDDIVKNKQSEFEYVRNIFSVPHKRNVNTDISFEPCSSKDSSKHLKSKQIINNRVCHYDSGWGKDSRLAVWKDNEIKIDKQKSHISRQDSRETIAIEDKRLGRKATKRFVIGDTYSENIKSKRRKLESKNKPTVRRGESSSGGNITNSYAERNKDDTNLIDSLMNKFQLDKSVITLEILKK